MPERIGAYRLESPLGRGGMGEVFLAWDERLERAVAIKRIRHDAFVQSHQRERFRREARMAARLSHAAIVQVHDLVSEESGDAIVMEYVEGPTLAERLARNSLGVAEAVHLAKEIAEGLAAAHEAGLIHRDLKAENVVITPSGHAKILDFGLARPMSWDGEVLTQHGALVGTCYAMSPEQASGGDLDERSDLFSLGALLYEMLTGHSPFRAKDPRATLQRVLYEQPEPLAEIRPDLPLTLASLVERLLAKDRDDRPRNALSVVHKLERIERELPAKEEEWPERKDDSVSEMPTHAFPVLPANRSGATAPRSSPKVERPLRRARGWILFLGGALVALIIAVSISYFLSRRPLRVLVMRPEIVGKEDEELALISTGVKTAALDHLAILKKIAPLDSLQEGTATSYKEAAHNAAADEVLTSSVQRNGSTAYISLRRVRKDGTVLWTGSIELFLMDESRQRLLADTITTKLQQGFQDHPPRTSTPNHDVRDADYAEFINIQRRTDLGKTSLRVELENLDRLLRTSPRFLAGLVKAAHVACTLFRSSRSRTDLDRASSYIARALDLAPEDPRTLGAEFDLTLMSRNAGKARAILEQLESTNPGDPQVLYLNYRLEDAQGNQGDAEEALRKAVRIAPSWRYRYWLSDLLLKRGQIKEARKLTRNLLSQEPDNRWVRVNLAYIETIYGDLDRAEQMNSLLGSDRYSLTNLGLIRSLQSRYSEAETAYARALMDQPGQIDTTLYMADAERNLGNSDTAQGFYSAVLQRLDESQAGSGLFPREELMRARCLVYLDRIEEAKEAAGRVVEKIPDDPLVQRDASLVYSASGDLPTALIHAKAALEAGLPLRWFEDSAFAPLRQLKEFQDLTAP